MPDTSKIQEIKDILLNEFDSVYCPSCLFKTISEKEAIEKYGYWGCEDCHRKYMGWALSEETAEAIAAKILDKVG